MSTSKPLQQQLNVCLLAASLGHHLPSNGRILIPLSVSLTLGTLSQRELQHFLLAYTAQLKPVFPKWHAIHEFSPGSVHG
jgi:hypothetical protein